MDILSTKSVFFYLLAFITLFNLSVGFFNILKRIKHFLLKSGMVIL